MNEVKDYEPPPKEGKPKKTLIRSYRTVDPSKTNLGFLDSFLETVAQYGFESKEFPSKGCLEHGTTVSRDYWIPSTSVHLLATLSPERTLDVTIASNGDTKKYPGQISKAMLYCLKEGFIRRRKGSLVDRSYSTKTN
jgi:hypothetical protein